LIHIERTFPRFSLSQRWEHGLLILVFTVLLLTGLPQKYRNTEWSQVILATPERVEAIRTIHRVAAIVLTLEAVYHLGKAVILMARRKLPVDMLVTLKDVRDAWMMG
jgi:formate dehydrogenase subunit gamma